MIVEKNICDGRRAGTVKTGSLGDRHEPACPLNGTKGVGGKRTGESCSPYRRFSFSLSDVTVVGPGVRFYRLHSRTADQSRGALCS